MTDPSPRAPGPPPPRTRGGTETERFGSRAGVTRREFEEVIRRATELSAREPDTREGKLPEAELFRIAREVGIPERHIRSALVEVRTNPAPVGALDRLIGGARARASRVVPHVRAELVSMLDAFFVSGELLEPIRRRDDYLLYRPSSDWISSVVRSTRSGRRYHWASARELQVRVEERGAGWSWIELETDPGIRGEYLWAAGILGSVGGVVAGTGLAAALVGVGLLAPVAAGAGALAGGGVLAAAGAVSAQANRRKLQEAQAELEGVLDELEAGRTLAPAPSGWRTWVGDQVRKLGLGSDPG